MLATDRNGNSDCDVDVDCDCSDSSNAADNNNNILEFLLSQRWHQIINNAAGQRREATPAT